MKELKIEIQDGYEFDRIENGAIVIKEKEKKYPIHLSQISNYSILYDFDSITLTGFAHAGKLAILAGLLELRDAWNKIDGFAVDWADAIQKKHSIIFYSNEIATDTCFSRGSTLYFGSRETRDLFLETFRDKIESVKELL